MAAVESASAPTVRDAEPRFLCQATKFEARSSVVRPRPDKNAARGVASTPQSGRMQPRSARGTLSFTAGHLDRVCLLRAVPTTTPASGWFGAQRSLPAIAIAMAIAIGIAIAGKPSLGRPPGWQAWARTFCHHFWRLALLSLTYCYTNARASLIQDPGGVAHAAADYCGKRMEAR